MARPLARSSLHAPPQSEIPVLTKQLLCKSLYELYVYNKQIQIKVSWSSRLTEVDTKIDYIRYSLAAASYI